MKNVLNQKTKANLALLGGGIFFGISSPLARLMGTWLNPFTVVLVRFFFAFPFSLAFYFRSEREESLPVKKLAFFALLFPISVCLYTFSLFYTKVSLAIFSFYIANLLSSILLGFLLNKEKISGNKLIGFSFALFAVCAFTNPFNNFTLDIGVLLGYLSGIMQTIASLYQKKLSSLVHEATLTLTQVIGGLLFAVIAILFVQDWSIFLISGTGLLLGLLFGFLFFLINFLMIYGFKHAEIGIGTILLSSELLFGPIAAYLIFQERLSILEIIGGVLIAVAVFFVSRHKEIN